MKNIQSLKRALIRCALETRDITPKDIHRIAEQENYHFSRAWKILHELEAEGCFIRYTVTDAGMRILNQEDDL